METQQGGDGTTPSLVHRSGQVRAKLYNHKITCGGDEIHISGRFALLTHQRDEDDSPVLDFSYRQTDVLNYLHLKVEGKKKTLTSGTLSSVESKSGFQLPLIVTLQDSNIAGTQPSKGEFSLV